MRRRVWACGRETCVSGTAPVLLSGSARVLGLDLPTLPFSLEILGGYIIWSWVFATEGSEEEVKKDDRDERDDDDNCSLFTMIN